MANIASSGESVRLGENAGLRGRHSSSILQAGLVQEEGRVRVSRNRARIHSRQPGIIEDNKIVIDDVTHNKGEKRRGVRKGVRKLTKKKASNGLLKQQILNRLVTTEPVQIAKEVKGSEPVNERRILKRKKGRKNPGSPKETNTFEAEQILQSNNLEQSARLSRHRLPIGRSFQRHSLSSNTDKPKLEGTTTEAETTTTVNPVMIWRQQAALAEEKSNPHAVRTGPSIRRGTGRRRKNFSRNNEKDTENHAKVKGRTVIESDNKPKLDKKNHLPVPFSVRIKTKKTTNQKKKDAKLSDSNKPSSRSFSFERTNSISKEENPQTESVRTSGRFVPSLTKRIHTFLPENSNEKSVKSDTANSLRRLANKETDLSQDGDDQSKPSSKEIEVDDEPQKIVRRPRIQPSKSSVSEEKETSHSRSTVTTSVTSTSFSVTHNQDVKNHQNESKNESKDHRDKVPSRRRSRLPPRRDKNKDKIENNSTLTNNRTHSKSSRRVDLRLKSKFDPRARSRGLPNRENSGKIVEENITTSTPSTRENNVDETKKKVQEQIPRLTKPNLATQGHKISQDPSKQSVTTEKKGITTDLTHKENMLQSKLQVTKENEEKDGVSNNEQLSNEKVTTKYRFRLENVRAPAHAKQNTNSLFEKESKPAETNRSIVKSKSLKGVNEKKNVNSISGRSRRPLQSNRDISKSKASKKSDVNHRLKLSFDPRRRNRGRIPAKTEDKDSKENQNPITISNQAANNEKIIQTKSSASKHLLINKKADEKPSTINENIRKTLVENEVTTLPSSVFDKKEEVVKSESTNELDTIKTKTKVFGSTTLESKQEIKSNLLEKTTTKNVPSGSRRRAHVPRRQNNEHPEPVSTNEKKSKISEEDKPRSFSHRFRQRFTSSNRQKSTKDGKHVGTNARQSGRARNRLAVQTTANTAGIETIETAPENYFDIAYKHAEVTWAQDPFRKNSADAEGPKFDIDYTKDPNYNSADNEGPVGTFSNFGKEEKTLSIVPAQTFPVRLPTTTVGSGFQNENVKLQDFQSVSSEAFGSFSESSPVFIPLFTPDLTKHVPQDSPLFKPFTISVHL